MTDEEGMTEAELAYERVKTRDALYASMTDDALRSCVEARDLGRDSDYAQYELDRREDARQAAPVAPASPSVAPEDDDRPSAAGWPIPPPTGPPDPSQYDPNRN